MLRIIELFNHLPSSYIPDPSISIEPGNISSLCIKGGETFITLCDGINPYGIIDDIKSRTLRNTKYGVKVTVPISDLIIKSNAGKLVLEQEYIYDLGCKNIINASVFLENKGLLLNNKLGLLTLPKGLEILPALIREDKYLCGEVNYAYSTALPTLDDSTAGSNRVTVWHKPLIAETNMFDTTSRYEKYNNLYCLNGLFSTKRVTYESQCLGVVLTPPQNNNSLLRFLFDPHSTIEIGGR